MSNIEVFKNYYKTEKEEINKLINNFNDELIKEKDPFFKDNFEYFKELNSNGKLIRGVLVNLGYSLLKNDNKYSNHLSLAYEIFQTSILIHDDIIDNDCKRRGVNTIHYSNYIKYKKYSSDEKELKNMSKSIAICMGDYGLYLANKVISDNYYNNPNLGKILSYFNDIVLDTIKGELLDVSLPFQSKHNILSNEKIEETILNIYKLKTAYYTIIGPLSIGLLLAGGSKEMIEDIQRIGEPIGEAYQIQDDILGIYSNNMGKINASDIQEFKQTLLFSYTINTNYKEELLKYYGNEDITDKEIERVKEIFDKSGAKKYATNKMNELYDKGIEIISSINWISTDKKDILRGFVEYLKNRNK